MTNNTSSTLYIGVTSTLRTRVWQHKTKADPNSFTSRYNLNKLVYYESYDSIEEAIIREKQLKGGSRKKKIDLIVKTNPDWKDLFDDLDFDFD